MEQCLLIHSTPPQGLFDIVLVKPTQSPHFKVCFVKSEGSETEEGFAIQLNSCKWLLQRGVGVSEWLLVNLHQKEDLFLSLCLMLAQSPQNYEEMFAVKDVFFYFHSDMPVTWSKDVTLYCISEISKHFSLQKRAFGGKKKKKKLCAEQRHYENMHLQMAKRKCMKHQILSYIKRSVIRIVILLENTSILNKWNKVALNLTHFALSKHCYGVD